MSTPIPQSPVSQKELSEAIRHLRLAQSILVGQHMLVASAYIGTVVAIAELRMEETRSQELQVS